MVATNVNAKFFIHQGLKIRRNQHDDIFEQKLKDAVNIYRYIYTGMHTCIYIYITTYTVYISLYLIVNHYFYRFKKTG